MTTCPRCHGKAPGLLKPLTAAEKIARLRALAFAPLASTLTNADQAVLLWAWRLLRGGTLEQITEAVIESTLEAEDGTLEEKAARLGVNPSTLYRWRAERKAAGVRKGTPPEA